MTITASIDSSKTEHDENFPVASFLIAPRQRAPILSFYLFARAADDIADHPALSKRDKFARLDSLEQSLLGKSDKAKAALPLRSVLTDRGLGPTHPLDLLTAFRADVAKHRYENWDELMLYCRYSAMPVGRFVLDLHGEDRSVWAYSDPLCSALQVINHIQIVPKISRRSCLPTARCNAEVWCKRRGTRRSPVLAGSVRVSEVDCRENRRASARSFEATACRQGCATRS
jgi:phytoene/squalene synthetase